MTEDVAVKIDPKALEALPFALRAEIMENLYRKDWLPSELDAIRRRCEAVLKEQANERQRQHSGTAPGREANTQRLRSLSVKGKTADKIGAFAGVSGRTIERIAKVVQAAEAEPERFAPLVVEMDRTRRVAGVYKKLVVAQKAGAIAAEPPPLPTGPFRVIVADPPWRYSIREDDPSHRGHGPYPRMSIEQICSMPVADIAHTDAVLWLWTTNTHLRDAFGVVDAWGFSYKTMLTWAKDRMGMGDWLRGQTEHCLMAVRGRPTVTLTNQTTLLHGPVREHSRKPDEFYAMVEALCPGSKVELFSRQLREGWAAHGDEVAQW